jgi:mono/diheme cytochrome c family protein
VATVETGSDTSKTDSFTSCSGGSGVNTNVDYPPSVFFPDRTGGVPSQVLQGPTAAVVDPSNSWLFVVNRSSHNLVVLPTHKRTGNDPAGTNVAAVVDVGAGADGIALSADGKTAYVYSQFDHALSVIRQAPGSSNPLALQEVQRVKLADDTLPADLAEGRRLFHDATDTRISATVTGISCSDCHVGGSTDGHVWQFPDGPRRTPALAGRKLDQTAPYHWSGVFPTLQAFYNETLIRRMGGLGLDDVASAKLTGYVLSMKAPENPLQGRLDLQDGLARGRAAFEKAGCVQCHTGEALTDNQNHDVRTSTATDRLEDPSTGVTEFNGDTALTQLNTPSLLGLARGGPYLHDGSVLTVRGRLDQARSPHLDGLDHGDTSKLSDQELADLETYLLSL